MPAPLWEPPHLLCVCVCVRERERDRERQRETERDRDRDRERGKEREREQDEGGGREAQREPLCPSFTLMLDSWPLELAPCLLKVPRVREWTESLLGLMQGGKC